MKRIVYSIFLVLLSISSQAQTKPLDHTVYDQLRPALQRLAVSTKDTEQAQKLLTLALHAAGDFARRNRRRTPMGN